MLQKLKTKTIPRKPSHKTKTHTQNKNTLSCTYLSNLLRGGLLHEKLLFVGATLYIRPAKIVNTLLEMLHLFRLIAKLINDGSGMEMGNAIYVITAGLGLLGLKRLRNCLSIQRSHFGRREFTLPFQRPHFRGGIPRRFAF